MGIIMPCQNFNHGIYNCPYYRMPYLIDPRYADLAKTINYTHGVQVHLYEKQIFQYWLQKQNNCQNTNNNNYANIKQNNYFVSYSDYLKFLQAQEKHIS